MAEPARTLGLRVTAVAEAAFALGLCAAAGFAFVAVPAAVAGVFRPVVVLPLMAVATAALALAWDLRLPALAGRDRSTAGWWWVAAAVVALASTGLSATWSNEHVLTDRDPGTYLNTAQWLASRGDLVGEGRTGPFMAEGLTATGPGITEHPGGTTELLFLHLLPSAGATGSWVAGDTGLTRAPAVIAGGALLALFAFATTLVRPPIALAATVAMALNLAFNHFARDYYTEPLMLGLLFGGLWAVHEAVERRSWRRALVAGAVLGATAMVRIDQPVYLVGLVGAVTVLALGRGRARWWRRVVGALAAPIALGSALAVLDGWFRSRGYVTAHRAEIVAEVVALVVAVLLSLAVVVGHRRLPAVTGWLGRHRRALAAGAAAAVVATAFALFVVRPHTGPVRISGAPPRLITQIQGREGGSADGRRSYAEHSAEWLVWYVGPVAAVAALAGAAAVTWRLVAGRGTRSELLLVAAAAPPTLLYLLHPAITPDHPWVMRRFLPLALPALVLLAAWSADRLVDVVRSTDPVGRRAAAGIGALAVAVATVAAPTASLAPVADSRAYAEYANLVRDVCATLPADAAVMVVPGASSISSTLPQALRGFCRVPAVTAVATPTRRQVAELSRGWERRGRSLWIVSDDPGPLVALGATVRFEGARRDDRVLVPTLGHRPDRQGGQRFIIFAGPAAGR